MSFRIVRRKYADLSGNGARLFGGRFNPPGVPANYTSESIALALLEVLVHLEKSEVPNDLVVLTIAFNARQVYRPKNVARLIQHDRAILRVPSVVVPRESNYVLFPAAPGFDATIEHVEPLFFDRRLLT